MEYLEPIQKLLEIRPRVIDLHPALHRLYPIAVVCGDIFFVYELDAASGQYGFRGQYSTPMPIPAGIRASFTLDCCDDKPACIVSGEVFDTLPGYVTIFHEFVHCYQWETCESRLKQELVISKKAQEENDFMWEIQHPFPYHEPFFVETYRQFLSAIESRDLQRALVFHQRLKNHLSQIDFEYLVWQEWKEGLARYVENRIFHRLGLEENHFGRAEPFHRVTFYDGGAGWIELIAQDTPGTIQNIVSLFQVMLLGLDAPV